MTFGEASDALALEIRIAIDTKDRSLIKRIKRLWDNQYTWKQILAKINVEGNVWVVWWQDGVNKFFQNRKRWGYR